MSGRPDKFPPLPAGVNPFEWILRTAATLRRQQAHLADIERTRRAQAEREALRARVRAVDEALEKPGRKGA